jgi:hypothetical protein
MADSDPEIFPEIEGKVTPPLNREDFTEGKLVPVGLAKDFFQTFKVSLASISRQKEAGRKDLIFVGDVLDLTASNILWMNESLGIKFPEEGEGYKKAIDRLVRASDTLENLETTGTATPRTKDILADPYTAREFMRVFTSFPHSPVKNPLIRQQVEDCGMAMLEVFYLMVEKNGGIVTDKYIAEKCSSMLNRLEDLSKS